MVVSSDGENFTNIGVAAYICAAASGGPIYNPKMTPEERQRIDNGIWLCQICSKIIDSDELKYTVGKLKQWKLAVENKRLSSDEVKIDNKGLLENLKLYENGYLTTSAILLFHKDPEKWIPGAYTRIAFFGKDDADLRYQDEIHGSLIFQVEEIVKILYAKNLKAYVSFNGMQRVDEYIIPETAAREIIYNFLQHKAYNVAIPTQIKVYENYLYFWNPGEIPNEVKDILFKPHPSMPRNLKISQTFFRAGFVEYWGSGIKRIADACKEYGKLLTRLEE